MNLDLKALGVGIGQLIKDGMAVEMQKFDARISTLAQRVADLESRASEVKYVGIFQRADRERYRKGNFFSYDGGCWCVLKDAPDGLPGESQDFQLVVRKGRDAKDGR